MPEYVEKLRALGELNFYTMKQHKPIGGATKWVKGEEKDFADVLQSFIEIRTDELRRLGWAKTS
jgi:hypothetical protein